MAWSFGTLVALLSLAATGAVAGEMPDLGATRRSSLTLYDKSVPLPPGDWLVVGHGYGTVAGPSPGPYGAIAGTVLVQVRHGTIAGVVLAHANVLPVGDGWGPAGECIGAEALFATGVRSRGPQVACAWVLATAANGPALARLPAWAAGRAEIARRGWHLPPELMVAGTRVGNRRDVVDVRYAWPSADPPGDTLPRVQRAMHTDGPLALWTAGLLAPWIDRAMRETETRLLDPLAATAELPPAGAPVWADAGPLEASSPWERRLARSMSSRMMQASVSFGVGLALTSNVYTAALLAAWQNVARSVVQYASTLGWEWEWPRPPMDFVGRAGEVG